MLNLVTMKREYKHTNEMTRHRKYVLMIYVNKLESDRIVSLNISKKLNIYRPLVNVSDQVKMNDSNIFQKDQTWSTVTGFRIWNKMKRFSQKLILMVLMFTEIEIFHVASS